MHTVAKLGNRKNKGCHIELMHETKISVARTCMADVRIEECVMELIAKIIAVLTPIEEYRAACKFSDQETERTASSILGKIFESIRIRMALRKQRSSVAGQQQTS